MFKLPFELTDDDDVNRSSVPLKALVIRTFFPFHILYPMIS